jgi:short-subunit dehydrogenase
MAACTIIGMGPGLGLAIGRRFGRAGLAIGMIARKEDTLAAAGETLRAEGISCAGVAADAASEASLKEALTKLRALHGDTQTLVYNAFTDHRVAPTRLALEDMVADLRVNVGGVLVATQEVAPAMIYRGGCAIVVTGGGYALHPAAGRPSLSLSKAALRSLVMSLAQELEPQGVRVGTVTIFGEIKPDSAFAPEKIAEQFFEIANEPPGEPNERQFRG